MIAYLAGTIHTPGFHPTGWIVGFPGGLVLGFVISMIIVHRSKFF